MLVRTQQVLPPVLFRKLEQLLDTWTFRGHPDRVALSKNVSLKGVARGRRAFLLATGPSIKQEELQLLKGEDCFSLSNFFLHQHIKDICPRFHFFAPYHPPLVLENYVEWLQLADRTLPKSTAIFLGHATKPLVERYRLFAGREVFYLYLSEHPSSQLVDITRQVLCPQSGPLMILPVLLYMGYRVVYLVGCDHSNLRDYKKPMEHFYPKEQDVRKNASDENAWDNVTSTMWQAYNLFSQYEFYKDLYRKSGATIVNLSTDSWLDMFEQGRLSEVISRAPARPE